MEELSPKQASTEENRKMLQLLQPKTINGHARTRALRPDKGIRWSSWSIR
jgi:hypothetical protein